MAKFGIGIGIGIVSLFLHNHIQAADVATTFTDQQRVSFIKKTIQLKCTIADKKLVEISKIKDIDKCLVEDKSDEDKVLSIKVSCKKDEVMNLLFNKVTEECHRNSEEDRVKQQNQQQQNQQQQNRPTTTTNSGGSSGGSSGSHGGGSSGGGSGSGTGSKEQFFSKDVETRWCKPIGPFHACVYDSVNFEEPKAACGPSNAGEVVMFGEDKLICGAGISSFQDVLDAEKKLAKADPKSLKSIVPTPKKKYGWALIKTAPVGDCAMSEPPAAGCNKAALGQIIDNCGVVYKCARIDGRKRGIGGYSSNAILADSPQAEAALDARLQQEEEAAIKAGGQK